MKCGKCGGQQSGCWISEFECAPLKHREVAVWGLHEYICQNKRGKSSSREREMLLPTSSHSNKLI